MEAVIALTTAIVTMAACGGAGFAWGYGMAMRRWRVRYMDANAQGHQLTITAYNAGKTELMRTEISIQAGS